MPTKCRDLNKVYKFLEFLLPRCISYHFINSTLKKHKGVCVCVYKGNQIYIKSPVIP